MRRASSQITPLSQEAHLAGVGSRRSRSTCHRKYLTSSPYTRPVNSMHYVPTKRRRNTAAETGRRRTGPSRARPELMTMMTPSGTRSDYICRLTETLNEEKKR